MRNYLGQMCYRLFGFFFFFFLIVLVREVSASETRVDSAGSLSLVISDETQEINPYLLGNPAGLALISRENRLQVSFPWFSTTNADGSGSWNSFGISSGKFTDFPNLNNSISVLNPNSSDSPYQGILFFPGSQWAIQLTGDFQDSSSRPNTTFFKIDGSKSDELICGAGNFGFLSFGAEIQWRQENSTLKDQNLSNNGYGSVSRTNLNLGLLENIQLGSRDQQAWLRFGQSFFFNPCSINFTRITPWIIPSNRVETDVYKTSTYVWTPSIYLDIGRSFEMGIVSNFNYDSQTYSANFTDWQPDIPEYKGQTASGFNFAALYKWKMPMDGSGKLTFNHGVLFETATDNVISYAPSGNIYSASQNTNTQFQVGLGLESEKDFLVGSQLITSNRIGSNSSGAYNISRTSLSLGGEKWIFTPLSLKMGLTYIDDNAHFGFVYPNFYWPMSGQDLSGVMLTTGIGYMDKGLKMDGMFWFEQPTSSGVYTLLPISFAQPQYLYTFLGFRLEVAVFF